MTDDLIGCEILGFRVTEFLGQGGMGNLWRAEHPVTGALRAIKVLSPILASDKVLVERFVREARIMTELEHQNILRVENFSREHLAMVMEFPRGDTLSDLIGFKVGPIPYERALPLMRQVLAAVGHAHRWGVVHRDLKPSNILVTADRVAKVMGFGIARVVRGARLTPAGVAMGTPAYMSPEQNSSARHADNRSDIYSLGVTFYEMLAGRPPFVAEGKEDDYFDLQMAHTHQAPTDPREFYQHIPGTVVRVVLRALEKDPGARQQSAAELLAQFEEASSGQPRTFIPPKRTSWPAHARFPLAEFRQLVRAGLLRVPAVRFGQEQSEFPDATQYGFRFKPGGFDLCDHFCPFIYCEHLETGQLVRVELCDTQRFSGYYWRALLETVCRGSGLRNPNIVRYLDLFETGDRHVLVKEVGTGPRLSEVITPEDLPLPLYTVKRILLPVLNGLACARDRGFPQSCQSIDAIIFDWTDEAHVIPRLEVHDGLGWMRLKYGPTIVTSEGPISDWPLFDGDIRGAGQLLYWLTTGDLFKHPESPEEIVSRLDAGFPSELAEVVRRALSTDGFESMESFSEALARCPETGMESQLKIPDILHRLKSQAGLFAWRTEDDEASSAEIAPWHSQTMHLGRYSSDMVELSGWAHASIRELAYRPPGLVAEQYLLLGIEERGRGTFRVEIREICVPSELPPEREQDVLGLLTVNDSWLLRMPAVGHGKHCVSMTLEKDIPGGTYEIWRAVKPRDFDRLPPELMEKNILYDDLQPTNRAGGGARIWKHAWAGLYELAMAENEQDTAGILVGRVGESSNVEVFDAVQILREPGEGVPLEVGVWQAATTTPMRQGQEVVGWWRSRSSGKNVMSEEDRSLHRRFMQQWGIRRWISSVVVVLARDVVQGDARCHVFMPEDDVNGGSSLDIGKRPLTPGWHDEEIMAHQWPRPQPPIRIKSLVEGVVRKPRSV